MTKRPPLTDRNTITYPEFFGIKVKEQTFNRYHEMAKTKKDLTEQVRLAIDEVVDYYWEQYTEKSAS
jgi:hypothetical protein